MRRSCLRCFVSECDVAGRRSVAPRTRLSFEILSDLNKLFLNVNLTHTANFSLEPREEQDLK